MKDLKVVEDKLEKIRRETEMKAEAFYQKHNILPEQKNGFSLSAPQKEDVSYTLFSNKTSNLY